MGDMGEDGRAMAEDRRERHQRRGDLEREVERLRKVNAELVAALNASAGWHGRHGESVNDLFEREAARFYAETGMWPPGKDAPMAANTGDRKARMEAWARWCDAQTARVKAVVAAALAKAESQP